MKKLLFSLLSLLIVIALNSCSIKTDDNPQAVLDKAWGILADQNAKFDSGKIKFQGKGNIAIDKDKGDISGSGEVSFDSRDPKDTRTALKADIKGSGTFGNQDGNIELKGELRTIKDTLYLLFDNLNIKTGDAQTDMMANLIGNLYKSQWISIPQAGTESLDPRQFKDKEAVKIAKKNNFFDVKEVIDYRKYDLKINSEKLKKYLKELSQASGTPMSQSDLDSTDDLLAQIIYSLQVEIDDDYELSWISGNIKIDDPVKAQALDFTFQADIEDKQTDGNLSLDLSGDRPVKLALDFTTEHEQKSVSIEIPEDAQEFNPGALLGVEEPGLNSDDTNNTLPDINSPDALNNLNFNLEDLPTA